jgi:putative two-component system response regulator
MLKFMGFAAGELRLLISQPSLGGDMETSVPAEEHVRCLDAGQLKLKLQRIASEGAQRHASGQASRDFFLKSLEWLGALNSSACIPLRLQCLQDCAKYFYLLGDKPSALRAITAFRRLALKSGEKEWVRKAHSYCAIVYADVGDFQNSLISCGQALRTARELGSTLGEAVVLVNIGYALMIAGLHTDAMRALHRAFTLGTSEPRLWPYACSAAVNIAQILFRQGQHDQGIQYIRKSLDLEAGFPADQYNQHRVTLESNYVQLAVGIGDAALADARLLLCEEFTRKANTTRASTIFAIHRGLCQVNHGDPRVGVEILTTALQGMRPMTDEWVDAQMFLIRGLEKLGEVQEALACVEAVASALSNAYQSSLKALSSEVEFPSAMRPDELNRLENERARLLLVAAQHQAARAKWELIERLAMTAELKDASNRLHSHRVGRLSCLFGERLGLRTDVMDQLEVAGRLHDLGKMAIPDQVLRSGSTPSPAERELLNAHARIGADLLAQSAIPELQCAEIVARYHHERWDGEGYPSRMKGKRIPVECRIVALADCFDAMTHARPHVRPVAASVALGEIQVQKGKQFDPELADAFVGFMQQLLAEHPDLSGYLEQSARKSPLSDAMRELGDLLAAVSEEKRERPALCAPPSSRPHRAPSNRSPEPL